jgi:hypothetical protein
MPDGAFKFEDDPVKHYIRVKGWLPLCRQRYQILQARTPKKRRRLKYFTFCAVNAVDVLMLDVAKIVHKSRTDRFDTVYFFDKTPALVAQTQNRIPGSIGFSGSFVETVLTDLPSADSLASPTTERDTDTVRRRQILQTTKKDFVDSFPFDVLNLDLEDLMFKAKDTIPGKVMRALRNVCEWQRKPLATPRGAERLDGFTLLFTTRVGPSDLKEDYAAMLLNRLTQNMQDDRSLAGLLHDRLGLQVDQLQGQNLAAFFELSVPKVIAKLLMDEDWYVAPNPGVLAFRFSRPGNPPYEILHFAMDVARQNPDRDHREPGTLAPDVLDGYRLMTQKLFRDAPVVVSPALATAEALTPSLEQIKAQRRKYFADDMG